jgi:hypothetical protein
MTVFVRPRSASYLDLHLEIDTKGKLNTNLHDKRDDFSLPIVNFPFLSSNIPSAPAYGVYVSQLICYSRACDEYLMSELEIIFFTFFTRPDILFFSKCSIILYCENTVSDYFFLYPSQPNFSIRLFF